jgi:hypothetical protein
MSNVIEIIEKIIRINIATHFSRYKRYLFVLLLKRRLFLLLFCKLKLFLLLLFLALKFLLLLKNLNHFGLCKKPRKAVTIININITVPNVHTNVLGALYDP